MRGAGGSDGGAVSFLVGVIMAIMGAYLMLRGIIVRPSFGWGSVAFSVGGFPVTTGLILIPFLLGIGGIFYDSRKYWGWALAAASLIALVAGVIANLNIRLVSMSLFDLLVILVLIVGGVGIMLRSLRNTSLP